MKRVLYGVFDKKADQVISEFVEVNDETATRSFVFSISRNPYYSSCCSDFNLVRIAEFDTNTFCVTPDSGNGVIVCSCNPELIKSLLRELEGSDKHE